MAWQKNFLLEITLVSVKQPNFFPVSDFFLVEMEANKLKNPNSTWINLCFLFPAICTDISLCLTVFLFLAIWQ